MKAYYLVARSHDESNPDTQAQLKSITIADHLIEEFKLKFGKKNLLTKKQILDFLESHK